uniref:Uncharacterized protein LOC104228946 n=1 Tax=Nicotiana sylvestris TaxID=4096 RepID=A0A1U7WYQ3_NICSY|nr:PREDICTED: uncharacterized protein LOC104228946 [Nicotiana sylvestris]
MTIKLVVRECTLNVVSAYAPHVGLDEEVKRCFWEGLDEIVRQLSPAEGLFIGGDFNGHIGSTAGGYGEVHGGFSFGERNIGGTSLLDFAKAFGLVIENSNFPKREEHYVTFQTRWRILKLTISSLRGVIEGCARIERTKRIPDEGRWSMVVPLYKNKGFCAQPVLICPVVGRINTPYSMGDAMVYVIR